MAKSISTTKKVNDYMPDDFTFSILSKLPLKSLVRFRCVRKSWSFLFENPYFMNMYRANFASNNKFSYVDDSCINIDSHPYNEFHECLFSFSGENFENKVKLDWPSAIEEDDRSVEMFGFVVDGTLCFTIGLIIDPKIVFWNLTSKKFKVLPPSLLESLPPSYDRVVCSIQGFGYDHVKEDHKVIQHVAHCLCITDYEGYIQPHDSMWEVYSLKSNSWKKLDVDMHTGFFVSGVRVHTNGVCHWWDYHEGEDCLVSFDLSNDVFYRTPLPLDAHDNLDFVLVDRRFVGLNGVIAFISSFETSFANTSAIFHISILGEVGVKESWTKLFIVGNIPCIDHPIGAGNKGNKGDIFFKSKEDEIVQFDLGTQNIKKLSLKHPIAYTRLLYKEVLLPVGALKSL